MSVLLRNPRIDRPCALQPGSKGDRAKRQAGVYKSYRKPGCKARARRAKKSPVAKRGEGKPGSQGLSGVVDDGAIQALQYHYQTITNAVSPRAPSCDCDRHRRRIGYDGPIAGKFQRPSNFFAYFAVRRFAARPYGPEGAPARGGAKIGRRVPRQPARRYANPPSLI